MIIRRIDAIAGDLSSGGFQSQRECNAAFNLQLACTWRETVATAAARQTLLVRSVKLVVECVEGHWQDAKVYVSQ
jgi:hypothetical protein